MENIELANELSSARIQYENAKRSGMGVKRASERIANIVINHLDAVIAALAATESEDLKHKITSLENDIESLNNALAESDKRYIELKKSMKT